MSATRIAVLMTCHNRKAKTLLCLDSIYSQSGNKGLSFDVYLVDDGCTDGTIEEVKKRFPNIKILNADGNLYWNRGMHKAFSEALQHGYDYYVFINDDILLLKDGFSNLLRTHKVVAKQKTTKALIVGTGVSSKSFNVTYGGLKRKSLLIPLSFRLLKPEPFIQNCDTMNGNCVLIPQEVAQRVGNLDYRFTHSMGDIDYGLRAKKVGCQIFVAPGITFMCSRNSKENTWLDNNLNLSDRIKKLNDIKGLPPKERLIFLKRHSKLFWPIYFIYPYIKVLFSL